MLTCNSFFDTENFAHTTLFPATAHVWTPLNMLKDYLASYAFSPVFSSSYTSGTPLATTMILYQDTLMPADNCTIVYGDTNKGGLEVFRENKKLEGASVLMAGSSYIGTSIEIGKGVLIEAGAMIKSPTIIGDYTEVRQGCYLRGHVISGKRCVLGHTTEIKHSIFLNDAKAGHFNYIGDSIMGNETNLGAGTKFANLRFLNGTIRIKVEDRQIDTTRRKLGAILGDKTQTGCNSVTNPGTLLGKKSFVLPNTTVKPGYYKPGSIIR